MNPPEAAASAPTHLEHLDQIQARLRQQYASLLKRPRPEAPAQPRRARAGAAAHARRPRRAPPSPAPPRRRHGRDWRGEGVPSMQRIFIALLALHVLIIGGIILVDAEPGWPWWKVAGGALVGLVLLRGMGAVCRWLPRQRTTTRRPHARNCDRDIWL